MNLAQAIAFARPHLVWGEDYMLRDTGNGPFLEWWVSEAEPDPEELEAAWLKVRRKQKEAEIAEAGRASLADSGTRTLDEAQIAATGKIDELVRYTLSEDDRAKIEAELDGLQAVRGRWNTILRKIDEAAAHADLDAIHWEMEL